MDLNFIAYLRSGPVIDKGIRTRDECRRVLASMSYVDLYASRYELISDGFMQNVKRLERIGINGSDVSQTIDEFVIHEIPRFWMIHRKKGEQHKIVFRGSSRDKNRALVQWYYNFLVKSSQSSSR